MALDSSRLTPDASRLKKITPAGSRWLRELQITPDDSGQLQMIPDGCRQLQMGSR